MLTTSPPGEVVASAARTVPASTTTVVSTAIVPIRVFMTAPWVGLLIKVGIVVVFVLAATWPMLCFGPKVGVRGRWSPLVLGLILIAVRLHGGERGELSAGGVADKSDAVRVALVIGRM